MESNTYGKSIDDRLGTHPRYFYALRRTDDGDLYFARVDQLSDDSIQINAIGADDDNYPDFESGIDFLEGRDVYHNLVYPNLNYEQMRWDSRNIYYYINDDGELVARVNQKYTYSS